MKEQDAKVIEQFKNFSLATDKQACGFF
jgi:hypothetical protein